MIQHIFFYEMRTIFWTLIVVFFLSCSKENEYEFPLILTGDVTDIGVEGAVFNAKIVDLSNETILGYGFVWDSMPDPTIEHSEKYTIFETPSIGVISEKISTTIKRGVQYYVRAFISDANVVTYGKQVTFVGLGSSAPEIHDFSPETGNVGDTVVIVGKGFSSKQNGNTVRFNEHPATVIRSNQDTIFARVPITLNTQESTISVSMLGKKAEAATKFNLIPPILSDFHEKVGTFGSQITVEGTNFLSSPPSLKIFFDQYEAEIISVHDQSIECLVPDSLNTRQSTLRVEMNNLSSSSSEKFTLISFFISDFSPKESHTGNHITLYGENFSPVPAHNLVTIGGLHAETFSATTNEIVVILPKQYEGYYTSRDAAIEVEVVEEIQSFTQTLHIIDKWFRMIDAPFVESFGFNKVASNNGLAYVVPEGEETLYEFDPINNTWTARTPFPGDARYDAVTFAANGKLYHGTGQTFPGQTRLSEFWEYDPQTDQWTQKSDYLGGSVIAATTFVVNDMGYVGGGASRKDFYEYNPITDTWTAIPPHPLTGGFGIANAGGLGFSTDGYVGPSGSTGAQGYSSDEFWKYTPATSTWTQMSDFPVHAQYGHQMVSAFRIDTNGYYLSWYTTQNYLWRYDSETDTWDRDTSLSIMRYKCRVSFSIGYVGYFINENNEVWEYDPNR